MKTVSSWSFTPYTPLDRPERASAPYVCRLVPFETGFEFDFIDNGGKSTDTYSVFLSLRGEKTEKEIYSGQEKTVRIYGLIPQTDYEFYVVRISDKAKSETRLVRTGFVYGEVVNYLHPDDKTYDFSGSYLCSPCLCRLPSGRLLSSMDVFRANGGQNLTLIFFSDDNGESWRYLTELFPCFWGQMFYRNGRLYMLGVSNEYGDILIGASDDEGKSWSMPTVLFRGAANSRERGLHRAPMKIHSSHGRIWTDVEFGAWAKKEMNNAVLSAPDDCPDYTDPTVWVMTDFWRHSEFEKTAKEGQIPPGTVGGIEGNIVTAPDGTLYDFLRYANRKCLLLKLSPEEPERMPQYACFVDFDITASKFDILFDDVSHKYYAICSRALSEPRTVRNLLSLFVSDDLMEWKLVQDLIDERNSDPNVVGFQYVSALIDGDDIIYLSRTAYGKPHNFHDSNYQTFHRVKNFRNI
ncbi:MAG: exo-alpha-sialidase [Clostridia bacterium]|nr:exo-alpha-sialidase [Clostridia bacterium]